MPSTDQTMSYWYTALGSRLGIWLQCPEPLKLKSILYSARNRVGDPSIAHLQIRTPPPGDLPGLGAANALWIINPEGFKGAEG